ncbi:tyrosine-type recombinase/integrase [Methylobacterium sp. J-043]|uniref:tyrosine-type recombinase/integrase n=1 Tax=Methylorubrum TaxID=2282523 RepID=UPI0020A03806|nr:MULTISPECIES: tyrosine-type recombinase/integrase [Methylorubrum]MCJ2032133.1 tyrosine-type recombinase/integrase [Methylobacterium sp. J-043]MCP1551588.1 integrase [Methylorubrum zatmanii]MCP1556525.1 integrase [Methylorubrum extorquens]MCP1581814.1 integrase [Methylorubrum extorquens]
MELDTADPASEPSRDASAVPVPQAEALPLSSELLIERLEGHARAARGAFADNTVRAFAADSRIFAAWCREAGRAMLPATPDTVAAFVDAQAELKSRATVERYRSSIAALHRAAGLQNPCADEIVRLAVKRMNRAKGRRQKQAEPLNRGSIERMLTVMTPERLHRRVLEGKHSAPLIALRNAALVAVAYDTLLRRSELVSLYIEDLHKGDDGSGTVLVRRSKADQEGEGAIKYLAPDTMAHIAAWLAAAGLESGPLFRPLTKGGRVGASALGDKEVARVFRALATAAGLKLSRLPSGHSTRVGATQDMFAAGFELLEVMQAGSWKTPAMPARYGERLRAQRGAARKLATLQNRA